jgi:hypothetical protein
MFGSAFLASFPGQLWLVKQLALVETKPSRLGTSLAFIANAHNDR